MTATIESIATNPDGSYTDGFLIWEARLALRVAAREVAATARALRSCLGGNALAGNFMVVVGAAKARSQADPVVAGRLVAWEAASQAFIDAAWALAEADPSFDIFPLIANAR